MSDPQSSEDRANVSQQDIQSALFAQLVMQQSNMAMMLMGKVAHPETGQVMKDLEAARLFIDMLEMLEAKTKGNLSQEEAGLLKQGLMSLRLTFVEAVESSPPPAAPAAPAAPSAGEPAQTGGANKAESAPGSTAAEEEHHKKFSKKY
jgi:hypothetical protein